MVGVAILPLLVSVFCVARLVVLCVERLEVVVAVDDILVVVFSSITINDDKIYKYTRAVAIYRQLYSWRLLVIRW